MILNEKEIEIVDLFLRLINRLGYTNIYFSNTLNRFVYYSSKLKTFIHFVNPYAYLMIKKSLEALKVCLIWNKFTKKDYWLFLDYIITFVSDFITDDFLDILNLN